MSDNYYKERDLISTTKTREIVADLPRFASEFFIGITSSTSALTRLNYAYDLRIFFDYLALRVFKKPIKEISLVDLGNLQAIDIEEYLEYLSSYKVGGRTYNCGASAKERKLASLSSFFKYYFNKDKLESNIIAKVASPKVHDKPIVRLEPNETATLLDIVEGEYVEGFSAHQNKLLRRNKLRDLAIITLFLGTGIRISELVGINLNDIDFENNCFRVTRKGGNQAILYFSDEVAISLNNYVNWLKEQIEQGTQLGNKIKDKSALFYSLQGKRITVRAVENLVKKYSQQAAPLKKITPHKLRSTFGTELYRNTQDIYVVADVLGHRDVNTTKKHYAAISDEIRKAAAKTVKLRDQD